MQICCFFSESEKIIVNKNFWQFLKLHVLATVMLLGWMDVVSSYLARSSATLVRNRLINRDKTARAHLLGTERMVPILGPAADVCLIVDEVSSPSAIAFFIMILPDLSSSSNLFGFFPSAPECFLNILKLFEILI